MIENQTVAYLDSGYFIIFNFFEEFAIGYNGNFVIGTIGVVIDKINKKDDPNSH